MVCFVLIRFVFVPIGFVDVPDRVRFFLIGFVCFPDRVCVVPARVCSFS